MNSALFVALRRLRLPIVLLISVYAVGMIGLVLIPGVDEHGNAWRMSFFDAFYFMSYTASTIGFGEIPRSFGYAQRLWVTFVIYLSVLGWAYAIARLLALLQDRGFQHTLVQQRFAQEVRHLREPFYLICGFGETGMLVCRALDRMGMRFVVIDVRDDRVAEVDLQGFQVDTPAFAADARFPANLVRAGLKDESCKGVLALTSDDSANLAVAMAGKLLHPGITVICRAMNRSVADNMASFGTDHIVNPFETFADYLSLAINSPGRHRLIDLLIGESGQRYRRAPLPPHGPWVVAGYGRFGREVVSCLDAEGLQVSIIDPAPTLPERNHVCGTGTDQASLREAGVEQAVGLVAGSDDDVNNLSIAVTARQVNPRLFVIVRQNLQANRALFEAYDAQMNMVPSQIIADRCVALLASPMMARFLALTHGQEDRWAQELAERLEALVPGRVPELWDVRLDLDEAPAVYRALTDREGEIRVGTLMRDPADRGRSLECIALMLSRARAPKLLPSREQRVRPGDRLLFAGQPHARRAQHNLLQNANVFDYVHRGREIPGGWVWEAMTRSRAAPRD